jgi:RNA-directed DNA polymerase
MIVVRYADDLVAGFEHEDDARRFLDALRERFGAFSLSLHPGKTRLIEFGRHAAAERKKRGIGRPQTFAFLGFTFICGKSQRGASQLQRKTRRRPHAGEAAGNQHGAAAKNAPVDPISGTLV